MRRIAPGETRSRPRRPEQGESDCPIGSHEVRGREQEAGPAPSALDRSEAGERAARDQESEGHGLEAADAVHREPRRGRDDGGREESGRVAPPRRQVQGVGETTAQRERHRDAGAARHDADRLGCPGQRARPADPVDRGEEDHQQGIRVPLDVLAGIEIWTVPGGEGPAVAERDVGVVVDVVAEADGVERESGQQEQERGEHRARQRRPRRSTHGTSTFAQLIAMVEVARGALPAASSADN